MKKKCHIHVLPNDGTKKAQKYSDTYKMQKFKIVPICGILGETKLFYDKPYP